MNGTEGTRDIVEKEFMVFPDIAADTINVGENDTDDVEEWLEEQEIREEDEITVYELFDQYERKGRQEGRREGLSEGIKRSEARRLVADIENAMKFFRVTLEKACEGLGTTVGRYEEAKKLI